MNIFEQQKKEKNLTLKSLEDIQISIKELKELEKSFKEQVSSVSMAVHQLKNKVEVLDIGKIGKFIDDKEDTINRQMKQLESATERFKEKMIYTSDETIAKYNKHLKYCLYVPIISFSIVFCLVSYGYFVNIRYMKNQTEKLVKQNELLKDRINGTFWLMVERDKAWYNSKEKKLYFGDNEARRKYLENLKKVNK